MRHRTPALLAFAASLLAFSGCGDGRAPTAPSATSFLTGTWSGTVTIQPADEAASTGATTWTFVVVPQTNMQSFTATVRSEHPWLPITMQLATALAPAATAPTQISTQGDYSSPRGCRGTLGSLGTAQTNRIEATFHGVDCQIGFDGNVVLTKN